MRQVRTFYYEGLAADPKPTGVKPGTVVKETDTGRTWITYDDGSTWIVIDKRVRLVTEDGTFIDLPGEIQALLTGTVLAAGSNNIGDVDVLSTAITKTVETELLGITKVAAGAQQKSSELALTNMKKATILIDHGRLATTAFVVAGTEYAIQVSEKASGEDTWRTIASVVAIITAATEITADGQEVAGQTLIEIAANTPAIGDIVFWENATLGNSEWGKVVAIVGGTSFTLLDGLTNTQEAAKKIYNKGEHFVLALDVTGFTRLRVVVNNSNGTTNVEVASRIAAITQV